MTDIPIPGEKEDDPFLTEFMARAKERKQKDIEHLIAMDTALYEEWLQTHNPEEFDEENSPTGVAYYDYIEELKAKRRELFDELHHPKKVKETRTKVYDLERLLAEDDPDLAAQFGPIRENITFLMSETYGGDMGQEAKDFAEDEIAALEAQIAEMANSRSEEPGDIWSQYEPARRAYNEVMVTLQEDTEAIQRQISEIERKLPKYDTQIPIPKSGGQDDMTSSDWIWGITSWNDAVRRVEFYNQGDTDCLPPASAEPWQWDNEDWDQWWDEVGEGPPDGLFSDPHEESQMQIEALSEQIRWLEIELNRENRQTGEFKEETAEYKKSVARTLRQNNAEKFRPNGGWHPNMQENIDILVNMGMEGHSIEVLFNRRDQHVQRDLVLRYGIDVGFATRMSFKVSHLSHMNCWYGQLEQYPNTTILLGLNIDRKNKIHPDSPAMNSFHVKTALRPFDEGQRYQYLEFKHAPGGTGFSFYDRKKLMAAHQRIMAELYGKKGPER